MVSQPSDHFLFSVGLYLFGCSLKNNKKPNLITHVCKNCFNQCNGYTAVTVLALSLVCHTLLSPVDAVLSLLSSVSGI